jgi:malate dehydrogenase (oxaloacetate-decarboxylating)/malate dehydrogenase (oxaloacetate-decarboxylating)(NADP+)
MMDSKGLVHDERDDINKYKKEFSASTSMSREEVFGGADVVLGLSRPGTFSIEDIKLMSDEPIIFTLANPTPEIFPDDVLKTRPDAIVATGRSDFDNQVNNVLGFPYIFRGALDVEAKKINQEMKIAAAHALAKLAREEVPTYLNEIYAKELKFSKNYLIPKPFDKRLIVEVSSAVALAAIESGVSDMKDFDLEAYKEHLSKVLN